MSKEESEGIGHELREELERIRSYCQDVFNYRDSLVAHRNLSAVLEIEPPGSIKIRTVRDVITDISALLNRVSELYGAGLPCDFHPDGEADTFDADLLMARLAKLP